MSSCRRTGVPDQVVSSRCRNKVICDLIQEDQPAVDASLVKGAPFEILKHTCSRDARCISVVWLPI